MSAYVKFATAYDSETFYIIQKVKYVINICESRICMFKIGKHICGRSIFYM